MQVKETFIARGLLAVPQPVSDSIVVILPWNFISTHMSHALSPMLQLNVLYRKQAPSAYQTGQTLEYNATLFPFNRLSINLGYKLTSSSTRLQFLPLIQFIPGHFKMLIRGKEIYP